MHGSQMVHGWKPTTPVARLKNRVYALKEAKGVLRVRTVTKQLTVKLGNAEATKVITSDTSAKAFERISSTLVRRKKA